MEEWDLQAVVNGGSHFQAMKVTSETREDDRQFLDSFDIFPNDSMILDELGDLLKPFYPICQQTIPATSFHAQEDAMDSHRSPVSKGENDHHGGRTIQGSKHRKSRKSVQKREVKLVSPDGLSSDLWAWRKYGQKPIKGSPYPRSYYRCSSSKACLARKQVERNPLDPEVFIVTYTNEHSHGVPTRRSSLAGLSRNKPIERELVAAKAPNQSTVSLPPPSVVLPQREEEENIGEAQKAEDSQEGIFDNLWLDTVSGSETVYPWFEDMEMFSSDINFDRLFEIQ